MHQLNVSRDVFLVQLSQRTITGSLLKHLSKLQVGVAFNHTFGHFTSVDYFVRLGGYLWWGLNQSSFSFQVDEEPAIRTNTTILLGNIATHLNDAVRCPSLIIFVS
jgi:hypothetical protein